MQRILQTNAKFELGYWAIRGLAQPIRFLLAYVNIQLTQSNSILRYLARKFNLYGATDSERLEIDVLHDEAYDFRNKIVGTAYTLGDRYQAVYDEFIDISIPRYLDGFERHLENRSNQSYFVGNQLSSVDFVLYELIWQASIMAAGSITDSHRPCLHNFLKDFSKIHQINDYMKSDIYLDRPINSVWASFV